MDNENRRRDRLRRWLIRKFKETDSSTLDADHETDDDEGVGANWEAVDDYVGFIRSTEMGSCIKTNELRVFVGTWNVAGRSPVGSLAVDVDDWLNLKDAADIYVLGFQEIVPLNTSNVLGTEDQTPGARWNTLIGKTLNNKYGCPWLTPLLNPRGDFSAYYSDNGVAMAPERQDSTTMREQTPLAGTQECPLQELSGCYSLLASKKMVGVFISIWIKKELLMKYCISSVKVCTVGCGIMGYLGNKGSVAVSMCVEGTSFCFIAAHLASGEKRGDEARRNYQVSEVFRRTVFPRPSQPYDGNPLPKNILGHDRIFWLGDLNYRLYLEDSSARQLIKKRDWMLLREFDQLKKEQDDGGVFQGWREGDIEFAPTYKYSSSNCNRYSGGLPARTGEKQRTPAWCDRILWYGKGVKQLSYVRSESKFSDHRPVSALFVTEIEITSANPPLNLLPSLSDMLNPSSDDEAENTTLLTLLVKDMEESSGNTDAKTNHYNYLATSML